MRKTSVGGAAGGTTTPGQDTRWFPGINQEFQSGSSDQQQSLYLQSKGGESTNYSSGHGYEWQHQFVGGDVYTDSGAGTSGYSPSTASSTPLHAPSPFSHGAAAAIPAQGSQEMIDDALNVLKTHVDVNLDEYDRGIVSKCRNIWAWARLPQPATKISISPNTNKSIT